MIYYDLECPIHFHPFLTVEEKPQFKCKCPLKECFYSVYAGDETNRIVDSRFEVAR
jgi:hypothetical protein